MLVKYFAICLIKYISYPMYLLIYIHTHIYLLITYEIIKYICLKVYFKKFGYVVKEKFRMGVYQCCRVKIISLTILFKSKMKRQTKREGRETEGTGGDGKGNDVAAQRRQGGWTGDLGQKDAPGQARGVLLLSRAPRRRKWREILRNPEVEIQPKMSFEIL